MDFDLAAKRLQSDQEKLRGRSKKINASRKLASSSASDRARRAELLRQKQRDKKLKEEQLQRDKLHRAKHVMYSTEKKYVGDVEHHLKTDMENGNQIVKLEAMSVHGQGDKITLPPSILGTLAERDLLQRADGANANANGDGGQQPLFFRLGVRRENYVFPQSQAMKEIMSQVTETTQKTVQVHQDDGNDSDDEHENQDMQEQELLLWKKAYLQELNEEYVSYTYASVVEFSQEEGYVGLPRSVANALLKTRDSKDAFIESHETVDPSSISASVSAMDIDIDVDTETDVDMDVDVDVKDMTPTTLEGEEAEESQTPGHVAYGLFRVPRPSIEISLLGKLPLGEQCTLRPTRAAIQNGFYNLKNIKVALERSIIGTRGCINVDDVLRCWFRGKRFELNVVGLLPDRVGAVSCVNCDMEVIIAPEEEDDVGHTNEEEEKMNQVVKESNATSSSAGGYRLSGGVAGSESRATFTPQQQHQQQRVVHVLPHEPSPQQTDHVIDVQIRGVGGKVARRRFDDRNSVQCLFDFARNHGLDLTGDGKNDAGTTATFKLVTRFPRRVLQQENDDENARSLSELGLGKQEMFLVEK